MDFTPLHTHSHFSIRDAISKIPDLVTQAKLFKIPGIALTDHGTLSGSMQFYKECIKQGIKPILGAELYIAPKSRLDKDSANKYHHITVIAMNNKGWSNLCTLVSESFKRESLYYKPRTDRELLRRYNEGLIVLSGCLASSLSAAILEDHKIDFTDEDGNKIQSTKIECAECTLDEPCEKHKKESYLDIIRWYKSIFGDRYYLEIQNHRLASEDIVREVLLNTAEKEGIKVVATGDTHFVKAEDKKAHDLMLAIRNKKSIKDPTFSGYNGDGYYLPDRNYLLDRFSDCKFAITNTMEIYERVNISFNFGDFRIPSIVQNIREEDNIFKKMVWEGMKKRFSSGTVPKIYIDRLAEEVKTITQMTYPSYFMMVADFISKAKEKGIPIGPGRGSAAGSLVSYALGITNIDSVKYGLSFSRFLNKGRCAIPQIDFEEYPFEKWKDEQKK